MTRDLALKGITTDGSALYPEPIRKVFGDVRHQTLYLPCHQGPDPRGLESGGRQSATAWPSPNPS